MNFVAGALLLACSAQDPAVAETPQSSGGNGAGSGKSAAGSGGGVSSALGASTESWEAQGDDYDGSGEDDSQARFRFCVFEEGWVLG